MPYADPDNQNRDLADATRMRTAEMVTRTRAM
jgi:hypothetical protein